MPEDSASHAACGHMGRGLNPQPGPLENVTLHLCPRPDLPGLWPVELLEGLGLRGSSVGP